MATAIAVRRRPGVSGLIEDLNTRYHKIGLRVFMVIVFAHLAEHIVQAFQIWVLGWARPDSKGVFGVMFPWLIESEALHYGYAIIMLVGLLLFRPGMAGKARVWWNVALGIQFWHHIEHLLLIIQAQTGAFFWGRPVPTSVAQLFIMRVELHLLYNTLVLIPMIFAMIEHVWPSDADRSKVSCDCARPSRMAHQH